MKAPPEVIFAQNLASNDKVIRDRAVKKLKKWLGSRAATGKYVSEEEMMKIWKGLHYCYWMSDKPLIQEELADNIANIVSCFKHQESSVFFFKSFLITLGREWFGIDRLRMDKFMMLVRRCLRQMLAYVKEKEWEVAVVEQLTTILKEDVMMAQPKDTSLGFQLHVADVFLEELAKIGADSVDAKTVTLFLQPFIEVLVSSKEDRLRDHVAERIFHHLVRQSDPGIEWMMNEDQKEMGGDEDAEEAMEEDGEEQEEEDEEEQGEEGGDDDSAVDPRAGGIDVCLPQIQVDYQGLAQQLFDLGSGKGVRNANRELLYKLSKNFKDVTQEVFPLGADLDIDQEIEKISIKKATKSLKKLDEDYQRNNLKNKAAFKLHMKEQKKKEEGLKNGVESNLPNGVENGLTNGDENGAENSDDMAEDNSNQNGLKRSSEEESDDEPVEKKSKDDENPNFDYKEKRKKQKQEQKKRKRERKLKEEQDLAEKEKKAQLLLDNDLEFKIALDGEKKASKVEASKIETTNNEPTVEPPTSSESEKIEKKKEKVKKNKKIPAPLLKNSEIVVPSADKLENQKETELNGKIKTKKNKKNKEKGDQKIVIPGQYTSQVKPAGLFPGLQIPVAFPLKTPAAEDISKEIKKIMSGEVIVKEIEKIDPIASETEAEIVKKKKKKNKDKSRKVESETTKEKESSTAKKTADVEAPALNGDDTLSSETPKKKKKKNKDKSITKESEVAEKKVLKNKEKLNVFEENDWDAPLKPGEQEIVLPNKKYKGKDALKPAEEAQEGFPGFSPPSITQTTPKPSVTASFLKKAMSKSASPKLKKSKLGQIKMQESLTMSEPRRKKVNFALTMNKSQDITAHVTSIASSPSIPHDPNKKPTKPLLSGQDSTPDGSKRNSVAKNTQINSKSKASKRLSSLNMNKRARAMEFF